MYAFRDSMRTLIPSLLPPQGKTNKFIEMPFEAGLVPRNTDKEKHMG